MISQMNPLCVLVADDNEDDVLLIREAFRDCASVSIVGDVPDGDRALDFLQHRGDFRDAPLAQFVLLDLNMPGKNGFDTLRAIKRVPELQHLPVAILTTSSRSEDVVKTYAEGGCSFISKPVDLPAFRRLAARFEVYWTETSRPPEPPRLETVVEYF